MSDNFIDMTGWVMKEHGIPKSKLTVIERVDNDPLNGSARWKCECSCGSNNDSFIQTQQNDLIKNKYCEENNITLLRIKYDENINDMLNKNLIESYN